jgi:hypothetical protein
VSWCDPGLPAVFTAVQVSCCSHCDLQAFLKSNQELELQMSNIQAAQAALSPTSIADLRRELDEANQERVQVVLFLFFF